MPPTQFVLFGGKSSTLWSRLPQTRYIAQAVFEVTTLLSLGVQPMLALDLGGVLPSDLRSEHELGRLPFSNSTDHQSGGQDLMGLLSDRRVPDLP